MKPERRPQLFRPIRIAAAALAAWTAVSAPLSSQGAVAPFRVVIDPGHGGADEGTVFGAGRDRVAEKDVTLELAREVARYLKNRGIHAVLTRELDHELPLPARTALANRLRADVFLSIHMNSTGPHGNRDAEGVETFILNNTTDASSKRLARLENAVLSASADLPQDADVALILKDLRLDANLAESRRLACQVQSNLVVATSTLQTAPLRDRGVKQALFHVLLGADMPSVLVEAGFLTHPGDRSRVRSQAGRSRIALAIADALDRFRAHRGTPAALATLSSCKGN